MNVQELKARLKAGQPVYGTWSHLPHSVVVEIIGASGLDFIVFDLEHGPHSFADLPGLFCAAEHAGMVPVTRVPGMGNSNILRVLDSGGKGVMVPHVDNAVAAQDCLDAMRYGDSSRNRGVATLTRASMFNYKDERGHLARQNDQILSVLMIEDRSGLEELDDICALPGLDVLFIGIYDLAQSLGMKADVHDPEFQSIFRAAVTRARRHGTAIGCYAPTAEAARPLLDLGVRFITLCVDGAMLRRSYETMMAALPGRE